MPEVTPPVLVVGGRTTGMFMAAELARHGISVRIIDESPSIDPHSRATYLRARTLEILHGLGLADEIIAKGQPLKAISIHANGKHVVTTPDLPVESRFPRGAAYAQNKTEVILERHLNQLGVSVERSTKLVDLSQTAECVSGKIRTASGNEEAFETPWLVGCDGSHSVVRKLVDEPFPGESDPHPMIACDVLAEGDLDPAVAYLCLSGEGDLFLFLLDEGRRQIVATLPRNSARTEPPTLAEMQRLVDERGFTELRLSDPRWMTLFHMHYRLVPRYRHGRVFLAGDAAHVHSFIGGQGMNTGIQDAHNLAWKLALVMGGQAPAWWLDSYENERRSVAADVLRWTKEATDQLTTYADLTPAERERLLLHLPVPESEQASARAHEEEIDLDYRASPLCLSLDEVDAGPRAGSRAPDASPILVDGEPSSLLEVLSAPKFHLLSFSDSLLDRGRIELDHDGSWLRVLRVDPERVDSRPTSTTAIIEDTEGELGRLYRSEDFRLYLIRPDGYVAVRCRSLDRLLGYVQQVGLMAASIS